MDGGLESVVAAASLDDGKVQLVVASTIHHKYYQKVLSTIWKFPRPLLRTDQTVHVGRRSLRFCALSACGDSYLSAAPDNGRLIGPQGPESTPRRRGKDLPDDRCEVSRTLAARYPPLPLSEVWGLIRRACQQLMSIRVLPASTDSEWG